jgi:uncharacterized protein YecT (DUF1311 family)
MGCVGVGKEQHSFNKLFVYVLFAYKMESILPKLHMLILLASLTLLTQVCFAQSNGPRELTPILLTKIKAEVEKETASLKLKLKNKGLSSAEIEFSVDTFRIGRTVDKRMSVDYSTAGLNNTIYDQSQQYDKLLNKYYALLLKTLKPADKSVLITAQRAWIAYRNAESKLIGTTRKQEYSGGGTMQSNIYASANADLVIQRTLKIFNYYNDIVSDK